MISRLSSLPRAAALFISCIGVGCVASIGDSAGNDVPSAELPDFKPTNGRLRRLTADQYAGSIKQLFGDEITVPRGYDTGDAAEGLYAVGTGITSFASTGVANIEAGALAIANQVVAPGPIRDRVITCTPSAVVDDACASSVLGRLARLAYRRPVTQDELAELVALAGEAATTRDDFHAGLAYGISAILQAPSFLYRVELGDSAEPGRFDNYELASRLSYFLWNESPDDTLLAEAEAGTLLTDEGMRATVGRMIVDSRIRAGVRAFFSDMFQLSRLDRLNKDPNVYVHFSSALGASAREETLRGVEHLVVDERGDYREIFTTRTTFVDRRLAAIYDVPAPSLEGFAMLRFPKDSIRVGLTGQVTFLALNAHAASSSATLRGLFVRNVFLCAAVPPPPANLNTAIPDASEAMPTLRHRVQAHLSVPSCKGCHMLMDPIGLGFEQFDGIGRFRTIENGATIDATGVFDQRFYSDARGLGQILHDHPDAPRCLVRTMYRYATGHVETTSESSVIRQLEGEFTQQGFDVLSLMERVALSRGFREARTAEEGP